MYSPVLGRLQQALDDVSTLAREQPHAAGDLPLLEGLFEEYQGKWAGAVQHYEQAWSAYDGKGYIRCTSAYSAALMALKLHRPAEAQAWRNHLANTDQVEWAEARQGLSRLMYTSRSTLVMARSCLSAATLAAEPTN